MTRITLADKKKAASMGVSVFEWESRAQAESEELSFDQRLAATQSRIAAYGLLLEDSEVATPHHDSRTAAWQVERGIGNGLNGQSDGYGYHGN